MPQITELGWIMIPLCLLFCNRGQRLLSIAIFSTAFGAASVLNLSFGGFGLGIIPPYFPGLVFIAFCMLRYLSGRAWGNERSVVHIYFPLIFFTFYCVLVTLIMPQVMAGRLLVWPQRMDIFHVRVLLYFGTGNISQLSYVVFNVVFCFLTTCYVAKKPWVAERLLCISFVGGYLVVLFGFWHFLSRISGIYFPNDFLYSNLFATLNSEQTMGNAIRISGSFSEPASLAGHACGTAYATFWLILRGDNRRSVILLFILTTILVMLSTSTTGYIVLFAGVPIMLALAAASTNSQALLRLLRLFLLGGMVTAAIVIALPWISPEFGDRASEVIKATLDKQESQSFDERTTWDADAISLMAPTFGFGAGWGSVRSSSLGPAILGGTGVWGFGLFIWFICHVTFSVRRARRRLANHLVQQRVVEALSASVVAILMGLALAGPNLNAMDAWLPLAAVLGIVVRTTRNCSPGNFSVSRDEMVHRGRWCARPGACNLVVGSRIRGRL